MVFQEIEWALMDEINAEDFNLSNITDEVFPIWSDETDDWVYWHYYIS